MNTYEITISPDPLLWVKKNGRVFQELLYAERAKIIQNEVIDYMKSQQIDFFIELHYEKSPKNGNIHAHGIVKTKLDINQDEFINVLGARLQRRTVKNRFAAVRIGQQDGTLERQKYWKDYICKEDIVPMYQKYYKYSANKWSQSMYNTLDLSDKQKQNRDEKHKTLSMLCKLIKLIDDDINDDNIDIKLG